MKQYLSPSIVLIFHTVLPITFLLEQSSFANKSKGSIRKGEKYRFLSRFGLKFETLGNIYIVIVFEVSITDILNMILEASPSPFTDYGGKHNVVLMSRYLHEKCDITF